MVKEIKIGGQTVSFDTETYARQAECAVMVRSGDTMVLTALTQSGELAEPRGFVPLTVEYREHISAAGKFPGGFFKREGRPTEKETLSCRVIDRSLRPLIAKDYNREIQVASFVFSAEPDINPDMLAMLGATLCLHRSSVPTRATVAPVRVCSGEEGLVVNPTHNELLTSEYSVVVTSTKESVLMLEGTAHNAEDEKIIEAVELAFSEAGKIISFYEENFPAGDTAREEEEKPAWESRVEEILAGEFPAVTNYPEKKERGAFFDGIFQKVTAEIGEEVPARKVKDVFEKALAKQVRAHLVNTGRRLDGRAPEEIRDIECLAGPLPRVHGSAMFRRGQTQALALITLGTWSDEQRVDGLLDEIKKRFILHYNFPPFSVGEVRFFRGPGRREIGHGALAEKALVNLLPSEEDFPYTIRVVSDILESNGSSSMASVCAGTLGLLDAGVPLRDMAAGVALGLIEENGKVVIMSDIAGEEDHYGDLDLKIAGTRNGITALQMDVKTTRLSLDLLRRAFDQSRRSRTEILDRMSACLPGPRESVSSFAPKITLLHIPPEKIGALIGPGGKNIRRIQEETGTEIEVEDDGGVQVISRDPEGQEKAVAFIRGMTEEPQVGQVFKQVKVTRILPIGAMVEIAPGREGLVHVSELDHRYVSRVDEVVKVGDEVDVKIIKVDDQNRVNLSRRALLPKPEGTDDEKPDREERRGDGPKPERRLFGGRRQPNLTHRDSRQGKDKRR